MSSPATNTTAGGPAPQTGGTLFSPNPESVVALFGLTLLFIIVFLATLTLPRLIALLNHNHRKSHFFRSGWLLKPKKSAATRARDALRRSLHLPPAEPTRRPTIRRGLVVNAAPFANDLEFSDEGHVGMDDEEKFPAHLRTLVKHHREGRSLGAPSHVPSWSTLLYSIPGAPWLSRPFCPGHVDNLSNGQACMYFLYAVGFVIVAFIMTSGTDNLKRTGWLVVVQTPLVVSLGSKNSLVGFLLGRGYEKINFFHRWMGQLMFISAVFHVIGYIILWLRKNVEARQSAMHVNAWAAFAGFSLIAVFSLPVFRRSSYRLFFHAHWVGYITYLVAICYHVDQALYWVLATLFILGLDYICRLIKSHYTTVTLTPLPDLRMTRIEIPHLTRGWKAGQHVRLRAASFQLGALSLGEAHPFTIASVAESGAGVVLYVKCAGDWSRRLYDVASGAGEGEAGRLYLKMNGSLASLETLGRDEVDKADFDRYAVGEKGIGVFATHHSQPASHPHSKSMQTLVGFGSAGAKTMKMIVEGPYGGPEAYMMRSSFTAALVVCGGSGVTYGLGVVEEMIRDVERLESRVRLVDLVWVVTDPACLIPLLPTLTSLLNRTSYIPTLRLSLTLHYTRAVSPKFTEKLKSLPGGGLPRNIAVEAGRPDFTALVSDFVSNKTGRMARGSGGLSGVLVGVCGPGELGRGVREAVDGLGEEVRRGVGGVEVEEEIFGW